MNTLEKANKKEVIKLPKQLMSPEKRNCIVPDVTLLFNNIMTSAHNIHSESIIISATSKGDLSSRQVVVAAGPNAAVKVGDFVEINIEMFPKETKPGKHDVGNTVIIHPPFQKVGSTNYFYLSDRHIKLIYNK